MSKQKEIKQLTLKDIQEQFESLKVIAHEDFHSEFNESLMSYVLNRPLENLKKIKKSFSLTYERIVRVSLKDFLIQNYDIIWEFNSEYNGPSMVSYTSIEVGHKKNATCIKEGYQLIQNRKTKDFYLMKYAPITSSYYTWAVTVISDIEKEEEAAKILDDMVEYAIKNNFYKKCKLDANLNFIDYNQYTIDDVILEDYVKDEIFTNVNNLIEKYEVFKYNNIKFKRGIILKGVPGVGKTMIGKALCNSVDCTFLWLKPSDVSDRTTFKNICDLTNIVAPAILFIEDIDMIGTKREWNADPALLADLMNKLDGIVETEDIIVVATTNDSEGLEKALKNRPGRFDRIIDIKLPSEKLRYEMLKVFTKDYNLDSDVDMLEVAKLTTNFTGAHIKELINTAIIVAIEDNNLNSEGKAIVKMDYILDNVDKVRNKVVKPGMGFMSANLESPTGESLDYDE